MLKFLSWRLPLLTLIAVAILYGIFWIDKKINPEYYSLSTCRDGILFKSGGQMSKPALKYTDKGYSVIPCQ